MRPPLKWEKVGLHIGIRIDKAGKNPKGDQLSIILNEYVDSLVRQLREEAEKDPDIHLMGEFVYHHNQVTVCWRYNTLTYGKIGKLARKDSEILIVHCIRS